MSILTDLSAVRWIVRTSDVNVVAEPREMGGTDNCTLLHSTNSFSFNTLMSCSTESSRTGSRDMVAATNTVSQTHCGKIGDIDSGRHPMCASPIFIAPSRVGCDCVASPNISFSVDHRWPANLLKILGTCCNKNKPLGIATMVRTTVRSEHIGHQENVWLQLCWRAAEVRATVLLLIVM